MLGPERIRRALCGTTGFLDAAIAVCRLTEELGVVWCAVHLMARCGRPMLMVDNRVLGGDDRRRYITHDWRADGQLAFVREHQQPMRGDGSLLLPLIDSKGLLGGVIRIGAPAISDELHDAVGLLANHVSSRFAELGVTAVDEKDIQPITPRQFQVAELAALGTKNDQIAMRLEIKIDTVKKHLKDVFERLDVDNRIALSQRLRRLPRSFYEVESGVTSRDGITITRSD